jgi:hypothetical protein
MDFLGKENGMAGHEVMETVTQAKPVPEMFERVKMNALHSGLPARKQALSLTPRGSW